MSNRLAHAADSLPDLKALELTGSAREPAVQDQRAGFITRAKAALPVGLLITGGVMTVLWMLLIFVEVIWLLFFR